MKLDHRTCAWRIFNVIVSTSLIHLYDVYNCQGNMDYLYSLQIFAKVHNSTCQLTKTKQQPWLGKGAGSLVSIPNPWKSSRWFGFYLLNIPVSLGLWHIQQMLVCRLSCLKVKVRYWTFVRIIVDLFGI